MYNENGKNYFFRDLIVKVLLVLLFVFLLMWLLPMPNLDPFYDKIFTQNMNSMTEAAKGYFTVSRLPQNEGETKKLTLADMINNKMLIEFTDSEGKTCDINKSYVEVTKKGGEYVYKTNLACSTGEDYVIEYFGCYDVCENDSCKVEVVEKPATETKKVTEYQFYKDTETKYIEKYICDEGYTLQGTKCVLKSEVQKQENASMKCQSGYSYNATTKKCELITTEKTDAKLTCPTGYIYASGMNKCIKGTDNQVDATLSYKCDKGTLVGDKCVISDVSVTNAEKVYSCKEGKLSGTVCIISSTNQVAAEKVYSCKEGTLNGTKCVIDSTYEVDPTPYYYCTRGTLNGTTCIIQNPQTCGYTEWVCSNQTYTTSKSTISTDTFTRTFLYQVGTSRVYKECSRTYYCNGGGTTTVSAVRELECKQGQFNSTGTKCVIGSKSEVAADVSYKCTTGTLNGTKCDISSTKEVAANVSYKCTIGTLNGTKCESTVKKEVNAIKEYKCDAGTLNGTKCEITNVSSTNPVYKCTVGTLSGNSCLITKTDTKNPTYYCQNGYTLAGTVCYIMESSSDIKNATPVYKTKVETAYKWSTKEKLTGWIRTGKTRTVNVAITSK